MKTLVVIFLLPVITWAQNSRQVLVAAPSLSGPEYQRLLQKNTHYESVVSFLKTDYQKQEVRREVFEMMDQCLQASDCRSLQNYFEGFRKNRLITPQERSLLKELWQKSGRKADCYWTLGNESQSCGYKKVSLERLGVNPNEDYSIIVDGVIFEKNQDVWVLPKMKYQWRFLSSHYQSYDVWATLEELEQFQVRKNPYVTGGCLSSSVVDGVDLVLRSRLLVAFDDTCLRGLEEPAPIVKVEEKPSWMKRNSSWVIPTLVGIAGGIYLMNNYNIEFDSTFR